MYHLAGEEEEEGGEEGGEALGKLPTLILLPKP